jgi:hypothetical protein
MQTKTSLTAIFTVFVVFGFCQNALCKSGQIKTEAHPQRTRMSDARTKNRICESAECCYSVLYRGNLDGCGSSYESYYGHTSNASYEELAEMSEEELVAAYQAQTVDEAVINTNDADMRLAMQQTYAVHYRTCTEWKITATEKAENYCRIRDIEWIYGMSNIFDFCVGTSYGNAKTQPDP